jgi:hypothetical protein
MNPPFMGGALARWRAALSVFLGATLVVWGPLPAQDATYQRAFSVSAAEAKAAVQATHATSQGRLPTLEGFVQQSNEPLERYEKGYYECTFEISAGATGAVVRAVAKVTAWYKDPEPAHSGYRVLVSNGRLETDALDRIAEALGSKAGAGTSPAMAGPAPHVPVDKPIAISPDTTVDSMKAARAQDERKTVELANLIKSLEEIQRNQSHPNDLAAVKSPKTPVYAKPEESAQVLTNADVEDEFPVLGVDGPWVHVQISGVSRGWIRRAQLEMPVGFAQAGDLAKNASGTPAMFKVSKEETGPFSGSWGLLKGKSVQIAWVEPVNPAVATSQKEKLAFAKSVFLQVSANLTGSAPHAEGVVVVFDSADGGQIAAPLSSVKALANHTVSDAAFWRQCSLDPPESFLDSAKQ